MLAPGGGVTGFDQVGEMVLGTLLSFGPEDKAMLHTLLSGVGR
jgi:hypothetical protein